MGVYPRSRRPPVTPRVFAHRSGGGDAAVNWRLAAFALRRRRRSKMRPDLVADRPAARG
ncbi:hypothetical protein BTRA_3778 [Burkholderia thailandensis USAMRU Malaysia |uniref:Uncharacterized protein n=1 Tax=Burkholderia thailandensis (strain ATCC 700388 / DSM 13276 / CCUG 48851 / CIP 106301 / E264) TaxID=271848 RepID=Q2T6L6_BURTA|nr:hypothetical protein BTH_II0986 [Burkholderia thailandensis E264]AHI76079.1 hypothetical protein BTQ_4281 [Burkholderia thailandensis 2002721723]AHI82311.1 hypothetical protein BTJ_5319 [Burkholderia thailandensis E444]AIC89505.1 hypothetical protein BTRA_3778 [Burkholderia thailandensis USAMRU Malaysia \